MAATEDDSRCLQVAHATSSASSFIETEKRMITSSILCCPGFRSSRVARGWANGVWKWQMEYSQCCGYTAEAPAKFDAAESPLDSLAACSWLRHWLLPPRDSPNGFRTRNAQRPYSLEVSVDRSVFSFPRSVMCMAFRERS